MYYRWCAGTTTLVPAHIPLNVVSDCLSLYSRLQVTFPSAHDLETFLNAKDRVEVDLASLFSRHLSQSAAEPCPLSCEVETELFLVAPDAKQKDARVISVSSDNCSECLSILKDSNVFGFGPLFRTYHLTPDRALSKGSGTVMIVNILPITSYILLLSIFDCFLHPSTISFSYFLTCLPRSLLPSLPPLFSHPISLLSHLSSFFLPATLLYILPHILYVPANSCSSFLSSDRLTLVKLVSELTTVVDWFHLGLYLGVPEHELFSIQCEQMKNVQQCRTDMLNWWLQRGAQRTWTSVVRALEGIKMELLARKIATKYGMSTIHSRLQGFIQDFFAGGRLFLYSLMQNRWCVKYTLLGGYVYYVEITDMSNLGTHNVLSIYCIIMT